MHDGCSGLELKSAQSDGFGKSSRIEEEVMEGRERHDCGDTRKRGGAGRGSLT